MKSRLTGLALVATLILPSTALAAERLALTVVFPEPGQACLSSEAASVAGAALAHAEINGSARIRLVAYSDGLEFNADNWSGGGACVDGRAVRDVVEHRRLSMARGLAVVEMGRSGGVLAFQHAPVLSLSEVAPTSDGAVTIVAARDPAVGPDHRRVEVWVDDGEISTPPAPAPSAPANLALTLDTSGLESALHAEGRAARHDAETRWVLSQQRRKALGVGLLAAGAACLALGGLEYWQAARNSIYPEEISGHSAAMGVLLAAGLTNAGIGVTLVVPLDRTRPPQADR